MRLPCINTYWGFGQTGFVMFIHISDHIQSKDDPPKKTHNMNNFHPNRAVQDQLAFLGTEDPKTVAAVAVSSEWENVLIKKERTGSIFSPPLGFVKLVFPFLNKVVLAVALRSDQWEAFNCQTKLPSVATPTSSLPDC